MLNFVLQLVCGTLLFAGFFFIFIEWKAKYDTSNLFFGTSLILLAGFCGIDLWVAPYFAAKSDWAMILIVQRIDHILILAFIPASIAYLMSITNTLNLNVIKLFSFMCIVVGGGIMTEHFLFLVEGGGVATTLLYKVVFGLFLLISVIYILYLIIRKLAKGAGSEKRVLIWHLAGFGILGFFGIASYFSFTNFAKLIPGTHTQSIFGAMAYGVMAVFVFSERFITIIKDKQTTFEKLQNTYRQLEEANTLKKLGESSAIINHQIKNQMSQLAYWIDTLEMRESLSQRGLFAIDHLKHITKKTVNFSQDILDMSRSAIIENTALVDICHFYRQCVISNFPSKAKFFTFNFPSQTIFTYIDWSKMEQAYVNVCQNALEAVKTGDPDIRVKLVVGTDVILLCVEDNGVGCTKEQEKKIFNSFFTTKPGRTGTGLGLTLTKNIVESHGGKISARSKNPLQGKETGLTIFISLPRYHNETMSKTQKAGFAIIRENMPWFPEMIQILNHVHADPFIYPNLQDFYNSEQCKTVVKILASTDANFEGVGKYRHESYLLSHTNNQTYILSPEKQAPPEPFTEEYVVSHLVG